MSNLPKEVVGLTAEAKALREKILALQTNLDGVLDNLAEKSDPLLEPLRKETEKLLAEKEKLQEEKHKINEAIALVDTRLSEVQSQRVELGERVKAIKVHRNNNSGLQEDIGEKFVELTANFPQGIPLKVLARAVAEKRGTEQGTVRQGIERYCEVVGGCVIRML